MMLAASVGVNLGVAILALASLPIVPIRPLCKEGPYHGDIDAKVRAIEGPLARHFFDNFERRFPTRMVRYIGDELTVLVTVAQALDWTDLRKQSVLAVGDVVRHRLGEKDYADWGEGRISVPGFADHFSRPDCELMRKFAAADGEWANVGPEPIRLK